MIQARSIGDRAHAIISRPGAAGRVLASFERVCDLATDDGEVLALGWSGLADGPLNILLDAQPGAALPAGARFAVYDGCLVIAAMPPGPGREHVVVTTSAGQSRLDRLKSSLRSEGSEAVAALADEQRAFPWPNAADATFLGEPGAELWIDLGRAQIWRSQPDWPALARQRDHMAARATAIAALLAHAAPQASLAALLAGAQPPAELEGSRPGRGASAYFTAARRAIGRLQAAYAAGDLPALAAAAGLLCGLGPGLTPAGDDWLAGWLLTCRLWGTARGAGAAVLAAAAHTTLLSRAFLSCAAGGHADASWHRLLAALAAGPDHSGDGTVNGGAVDGTDDGVTGTVIDASRAILAHGATSGADMLAGFVAGLAGPPPAASLLTS